MNGSALEIARHIDRMSIDPDLRQRLHGACATPDLRFGQRLTTLFNVLHAGGQHGAADPDGWRRLIALLMGRALAGGHDLSSVHETYRNAHVHNRVMGHGWHAGDLLVYRVEDVLYLHEDVRALT